MKKIFVLLGAVIILSMLLSACGAQPSEQAAEEPEVLRVWIQWGDNPQQLQELFDKYGAANNVKVEVTAPVETDKILPALTGSEPPDVLILSGGDLVKSYAKDGVVEELSSAIKTGGIDMGDFYSAPLQQCLQGDKVWCLPWGTDLYALYYNKDLYEAAGLDPNSPPTTMEQLEEYADKLTKVDADGKLEQIGFIPDQAWSHIDLYARMFGGYYLNDDGTQMTVNSQPVIDALLWQQKFYEKYGYDNVMSFSSGFGDQYMSPDQPFLTGKLAMYTDGEWMTGPNFISKLKPELNYGVAPFPPPADHPERANTVVNQGTVAVIPSGAQNKDASAKLLAWMMTPDIVAEEFCYNANLPTSKKAAEAECFQSNPKFKLFVDLMGSPNASFIPTTPISIEINDAFAQIEQAVLHTGADPKPLLDAMQTEFEPKLQEALNQ